jgi:hypothetical protein
VNTGARRRRQGFRKFKGPHIGPKEINADGEEGARHEAAWSDGQEELRVRGHTRARVPTYTNLVLSIFHVPIKVLPCCQSEPVCSCGKSGGMAAMGLL